MDGCVVCGGPRYLAIDERDFCSHHAAELLVAVEELIDRMRDRHRRNRARVNRFVTMKDFANVAGS